MVAAVEDPLALDRQVCFALAVANREVVALYRPVLEPLGLTHPQYLVMLALWERDSRSLRDLAETLALDPGTLSPLVKRLEAAGLVRRKRVRTDERVLAVTLTPQGRQLRTAAEQVPERIIERLGLSVAQLQKLNTTLRAVIKAASDTDFLLTIADNSAVSIDSEESAGVRRSGFEMPAEPAAVARIAAVLGELAAATSMDDIVMVVASHIREAVQAAVSTLVLRDGDQLEIAGQVGVASEKADRWARFAVADANPASEAVRTRQPVVAATAEEVRRRYPIMAADTPPTRSVVNLPLRTPSTVLGVVGLTFEDNWNPGPFELDFLMTFADACAQVIQRIQATQEADESARRLEFLARASVELSTSLDYRTTLTNVAHLAVPELADWCAVDLLVDGQLTTLAVAHADPEKVAWAWRLRERYPTDMSASTGAPKVVRTGVGELTSDITDEMLAAAARDEQHLQLSRELNLRSVMIVPLLARGRTLGTVTLIRSEPSPNFAVADLAAAEDLGRRAGIAIDNARLYHDAANVAAELQRAVLPDELGELDGWRTAVYYRPDGHAEVGGDFYDAVELPDGRLAVFIGDVMGHGIKAAAAMAQVRAAIRAFVTVDPDPDAVLARLDSMFEHLRLDTLVSVVYAVIDKTGLVQLANAGHCPTLLVRADGATEFVMNVPRPPLGAGPGATCIVSATLAPGDALLLYTDGLVERRDEPLDAGFARLAHHAHQLLGADMAAGLNALVADIAAEESRDDVAALAVRRTDQQSG